MPAPPDARNKTPLVCNQRRSELQLEIFKTYFAKLPMAAVSDGYTSNTVTSLVT